MLYLLMLVFSVFLHPDNQVAGKMHEYVDSVLLDLPDNLDASPMKM